MAVLSHENCEAGYQCVGCGKETCPRCEPSPREADEMCGSCFWLDDPDGGMAA